MARETDLHEIAARLEELNRKYDLASQGLKSGSTGVGLGFVVAVLVLAIAAATHFSDDPLFTGNQVVWVIGIVVGGLLGYFAMVFSRELSVRTEITEAEKTIVMALGKSVSGGA